MATELETIGTLLHVRENLRSGHAQETVHGAGLTNADVARVIGVSAPTVWHYFHSGRVPRRATALKLAKLLRELEVIDRAR